MQVTGAQDIPIGRLRSSEVVWQLLTGLSYDEDTLYLVVKQRALRVTSLMLSAFKLSLTIYSNRMRSEAVVIVGQQSLAVNPP